VAGTAALTRTGALGAIRTGGVTGVELSAADGAVAVGVQRGEAVVGSLGALGLHGGLTLGHADRAVAVGVQRGKAGHASLDEGGAGQVGVPVGQAARIGRRGTIRRRRRNLGRGDPGAGAEDGGQGHGAETVQNDVSHLDNLLEPP